MSILKKFLSGLILFLLVFAVVFAIKETSKEPKNSTKLEDNFAKAPTGKKAPDFTLKNVQGELVTLSDFRGKKVMVNFWATWCPPCQEEMPEIERFHNENPDVIILSINIDTTQDIQGFIDEYQTTFPVLLDEDKNVAKAYGTFKIPETYFINRDGIVKHKQIGAMKYNDMKTVFDSM